MKEANASLRSPHRATIRDVARRAGVSIKTVSRVINREANVRPETRELVVEAVRELQYEPNPAARGLAGRRTFSIGLLYENPHEFSYIQQILDGVFGVCQEHGYALLLRPSSEEPATEDIVRFLTQTRVDGVVLTAPIGDRPEVTDALADRDVPFVQISPGITDTRWTSVGPDDLAGSRALTEHLLDLGHRRIGFIKGDPRHGAAGERLAGHLQALQGRSMVADETLIVPGLFDFESGKSAAHGLFRLAERPTAIIASNDDMAAGAIVAAREVGIALPTELSVAGFDDSPTALHTWPPLTTVRQPIVEIASQAAVLLLEWIRGERDAHVRKTFDCRLVVRRSTSPPGP